MVENELEVCESHVLDAARAMMAAARTAPKTQGVDNLTIITVSGDDRRKLAAQMRKYGEESGMSFFVRDAESVGEAHAIMVIGTTYEGFGIECNHCGMGKCVDRPDNVPCMFNIHDLGLAIGSAVSVAADRRVDNRVMYSAGRSALDLGWLGDCRASTAIVLSCTGKNPFFDR